MLKIKNDIITRFRPPAFVAHPRLEGLETLGCLVEKAFEPITIELSKLKIVIHSIDYLRALPSTTEGPAVPLRFQQDSFRLWYQINGQGILQNVTRNTFGAARPGLLGAMEQCERHTYLHQRDTFECFIMEFSLLPSKTAKCYWNSAIEGKKILDKEQQRDFENILIDMFNGMTGGRNRWGAATCARLLDMITVLLENGLLVIEESQFPKNKAGSLVAKARQFMKLHYHRRRHQSALEKECGVDINYLNIIFKKETGRTLYQYLTDIRLEQAKHLLEDTGQSVSDIGARVGYPNNNSFTRAFGKYAGATPSAYRAAHGRGAAEGPAGNSPVTTPP